MQTVLRELLNPRQWKPPEDRSFILDGDQINTLCDQAERVFQQEASVLRLRGAAALPAFQIKVKLVYSAAFTKSLCPDAQVRKQVVQTQLTCKLLYPVCFGT